MSRERPRFSRVSLGVARGPGNENYYSPHQSDTTGRDPADTQEMQDFRAACGNGNIASTFQSMLPTLPTAEAPAGLSRSVSSPGPNPNLLQITYIGTISGSAVSTRVINVIPTAANWCP